MTLIHKNTKCPFGSGIGVFSWIEISCKNNTTNNKILKKKKKKWLLLFCCDLSFSSYHIEGVCGILIIRWKDLNHLVMILMIFHLLKYNDKYNLIVLVRFRLLLPKLVLFVGLIHYPKDLGLLLEWYLLLVIFCLELYVIYVWRVYWNWNLWIGNEVPLMYCFSQIITFL